MAAGDQFKFNQSLSLCTIPRYAPQWHDAPVAFLVAGYKRLRQGFQEPVGINSFGTFDLGQLVIGNPPAPCDQQSADQAQADLRLHGHLDLLNIQD
jgi:hypothetical protein